MLKKLEDVPSYVAGFVATGEVNKDDYSTVLVPELERLDKQHGHIHLLMILETPVKNFSIGAWLLDAWMGLKHFRGLKKVAIVTDETGVETFTNKISALIHGETRGFKLSEKEIAKNWVAEE
ncbi:MAG: STAS/SEC14 domain-containing protein [Parafilimonas sp.]